MLAEPNHIKLLLLISVIFVLIMYCDSEKSVKRNKRKNNEISVSNRITQEEKRTRNDSGRGLFFRGGLLSFSKVLNFFPVGGERECQPTGYNIARAGICLNAYDCRQRDGKSAGDCAHGLGVCCVFETSCGGRIQNNLTYFMSPGFPEFWTGDQDCNITIDKTHAGIMQLRIDLLHFSIGQPNRTTGECDEDVLILGEGASKFTLCGQNHGQHLYYTLSSKSEAREAGELASEASTTLSVRMRGAEAPRIWLMRFAQMPLAYSAPHGCLQYFTGDNGTIKTFNYATNGRHLANQEYKSCIKRNKKKCSVRYKPCDARSFRIGSGEQTPNGGVSANLGPGSQGGPGTGFYGPDGSFYPGVSEYQTNQSMDQVAPETNGTQDMVAEDPMETLGDEMEGSGDVQMEPMIAEEPSMFSRIWTYITSWWGQSGRGRAMRWSPYTQHYREDDGDRYKYYGYGDYGGKGYGRLRCQDRVTITCENEYFVSGEYYGVGVCDPHHCGNNFCPGSDFRDCAVESSITPFEVSVHFGPPTIKRNPEENIGMCLRYFQMPCDS